MLLSTLSGLNGNSPLAAKPAIMFLGVRAFSLAGLYREVVTVYEVGTSRVPRALFWCSSLTSMSTFYLYRHQRYVM
jgi:hypothetical protein